MLKRALVSVLACLLLSFGCFVSVTAGAQIGKDQELAGKVKTKVAKLGTGSKARVKIKLKNGTTVEGNVREIGDDYFVVADKAGADTKVPYADVKQVKTNNGLDRGVLLAVIVVPVVLVLSVLAKGN